MGYIVYEDLPLPPGKNDSPFMNSKEVAEVLDDFESRGLIFVGFGQKVWKNGYIQTYWIFKESA